ncbi:hypothetical protein F2Q69_00047507 [Brassica cretica]|uniref:Uncharacterized protein n=1 Tax=Brassica cretica TaxID=69181 RepID=A0A8S9Q5K4_BRACR|nr:hypothetical protein F2Q69_00047507 [Brassica cretica]
MEWDSDSNLIGGDAVADDGWFGGDSGPVPFPANSLPGMTPSGTMIIIKRIVWEMEEYDRYKRVYYRKKKNTGGKDEAGEMALATEE